MNLVHYNPTRSLSRKNPVHGQCYNNIFDDLLNPFFVQRDTAGVPKPRSMKVDIYEKDDVIFIEAELPGVEKDDISVDVKGKLLTLGGERKSKEEVSDENCYRRERTYGKFERTFNLPFEIKSRDVKAHFSNGILGLEIAKPEEQVKQKITIN